MTTIIPELIKQDWNSRGYSFGIFRDPPGQVWADFVHQTDELLVLAEGEIEVEIEGKSFFSAKFFRFHLVPNRNWYETKTSPLSALSEYTRKESLLILLQFNGLFIS